MALPNVNGPNRGNEEQQLKARIKQWIREELAAAAAGGIGLHVDGATGNLIIDKGQEQSGNYVAGTSGWALFPTGNAEFNSLTLRGGIIGNDALTNPVIPTVFSNSASGFALPSSGADLSVTLTAPSGMTRCAVSALYHAQAQNNSGTSASFSIFTNIAGVQGDGQVGQLVNGTTGYDSQNASQVALVASTSFTIAGNCRYGYACSAYAANSAHLYGIALWFR